jgi:hypothetical protein
VAARLRAAGLSVTMLKWPSTRVDQDQQKGGNRNEINALQASFVSRIAVPEK